MYPDRLSNTEIYGWHDLNPTRSHAYVFPTIEKLLKSPGPLKILDIGCGNGWTAGHLASLGHNMTAMDASSDGIRLAADAFPSVTFHLRSIYDPMDDFASAFDIVLATEVIEHLYSPSRLVQQARLVLRPGGHLILSTPYHGYLKNLAICLANGWDRHHTTDWEGGHIKFFSKATLRHLLESNGMKNITFFGAGRAPLFWKSMIVCATS